MKGGTQGFPRHEVSDKQEVLFEDVSPSTALSIRQLGLINFWHSRAGEALLASALLTPITHSQSRAIFYYFKVLSDQV